MYILPSLIQVEFDKDLHIQDVYIGMPGTVSGDEPYYLVTTTSLINDHDYYVENNYDNAYLNGGCDAGFRFINNTNKNVHRQTAFFDQENRITIINGFKGTYEKTSEFMKEEYGSKKLREVPSQSLGLPIFSSIFLWPFKETCFIEHGAIFLSILVSFVGIIFFYLTCLYYVKEHNIKYKKVKRVFKQGKKEEYTALFFTLIFAFGTQYWHYSKTYFTEPYIASLLICAYYLFFIKKMNFLPGFILAVGFSMKYPAGMYLPLFGITLMHSREWKRFFYFCAGSVLPFIGVLYHNWFLTGSIFGFRQLTSFSVGNYFYGIFVWLFNPNFGLLPFAPFFIFSFLGLLSLYRIDKRTFVYLSLTIFPYFFFWTSYTVTQTGPVGYSARYFVPLVSFFVILSMLWYLNNTSRILKWIFLGLVGISVIINAQAAFLYFIFWNNPPWILITKIITKWNKILYLIGL